MVIKITVKRKKVKEQVKKVKLATMRRGRKRTREIYHGE